VDFGLAVMKRKLPTPPTVPTDLRDWVALKARIGSAALEGMGAIGAEGGVGFAGGTISTPG